MKHNYKNEHSLLSSQESQRLIMDKCDSSNASSLVDGWQTDQQSQLTLEVRSEFCSDVKRPRRGKWMGAQVRDEAVSTASVFWRHRSLQFSSLHLQQSFIKATCLLSSCSFHFLLAGEVGGIQEQWNRTHSGSLPFPECSRFLSGQCSSRTRVWDNVTLSPSLESDQSETVSAASCLPPAPRALPLAVLGSSLPSSGIPQKHSAPSSRSKHLPGCPASKASKLPFTPFTHSCPRKQVIGDTGRKHIRKRKKKKSCSPCSSLGVLTSSQRPLSPLWGPGRQGHPGDLLFCGTHTSPRMGQPTS